MKFCFEPGSYEGPVKAFLPSILCKKRVSETDWCDHFVLANPTVSHNDHDAAVAQAETDLAEAFAAKQNSGTDVDLATCLKNKGYTSITGFKIIRAEGNVEQEGQRR